MLAIINGNAGLRRAVGLVWPRGMMTIRAALTVVAARRRRAADRDGCSNRLPWADLLSFAKTSAGGKLLICRR